MSLKKILVVFTFFTTFLLATTLCATLVEPVKADPQISIVNHQGYVDLMGYYNVYGEVINNGNTPAKNVYLSVIFTSSSGDDDEETEAYVKTILPGRKSPFMCTAGQAGSSIISYKIELLDLTMTADDLPKALEIVSSQNQANMLSNMRITGSVKNNGADSATYVRVYATVYDGPSGTGNVVAVSGATVKTTNIGSGQSGEFEMGFWITPGKTYASYVLVAESEEYTVTTEYVASLSQSSTTPPSSTSSPSSTGHPTATVQPSSTSLSPSPSIPEFPLFFVPVLAIAVLIAVVVAKKHRSKPQFSA